MRLRACVPWSCTSLYTPCGHAHLPSQSATLLRTQSVCMRTATNARSGASLNYALTHPRSRTSSRRSLLAVKVRKRAFTRFTAGRSSSHKIFARQIFCGSPEKRSLRDSVGSCPNLHHTISLFRFSHSLRARAPATAICNPSPHSIGFRCLRCIFELRSRRGEKFLKI